MSKAIFEAALASEPLLKKEWQDLEPEYAKAKKNFDRLEARRQELLAAFEGFKEARQALAALAREEAALKEQEAKAREALQSSPWIGRGEDKLPAVAEAVSDSPE